MARWLRYLEIAVQAYRQFSIQHHGWLLTSCDSSAEDARGLTSHTGVVIKSESRVGVGLCLIHSWAGPTGKLPRSALPLATESVLQYQASAQARSAEGGACVLRSAPRHGFPAPSPVAAVAPVRAPASARSVCGPDPIIPLIPEQLKVTVSCALHAAPASEGFCRVSDYLHETALFFFEAGSPLVCCPAWF